MKTIRAFVVATDYVDVQVLVFATSASKAKGIAHASEWFCDEDWIELRARREPAADGYRSALCYLEIDTEEDQRLVRNLGWFEIDGPTQKCGKCGLHQWRLIPESKLCQMEEGYICVKCKEGDT